MPTLKTNTLGGVSMTTVALGAPSTWLVAGILPVLWQPSVFGAIAWGAAMVVGGFIAREQPLRWIALGWIAWAAIPGAPFLAIAASGTVAGDRRNCVYAALFGSGLCLLALPDVGLSAGTLLIYEGCVATLWELR